MKAGEIMNNEGCKGYVMKALNFMIKKNEIDGELAHKVLQNVHWEFSLLTEEEAEEYYHNNSINRD